MKQILTITFFVVIWLIAFLEPSGWGHAYHLTDKVNQILCISATFIYMFDHHKNNFPISRGLALSIIIFMILIPRLTSNTWEGLSYLIFIVIVYIISQFSITEKLVKYISIIYALMGLCLLYIYKNMGILDGWNDNAISMYGLFSFLYFSIFLITNKSKKGFWRWNIMTLIYIEMLLSTRCRSGMIFSILGVLAIIYSENIRLMLKNKFIRLTILNVPLIITSLITIVKNSFIYEMLNLWSMREVNKPLFNGRDELWSYAFDDIYKSDFVGLGKFYMNFHNSGLAALSVYGICGYVVWIIMLNSFIKYMLDYSYDRIVMGAMIAFILVFLQQSFDLGFISPEPNLIIYTILGVGIGRVNTLKSRFFLWRR